MSDEEEKNPLDNTTSGAETSSTQLTPNNPAPLDRTFQILAVARRRYALYFLQEQGSVEVEDIARYLAGLEDDASPRDHISFQQAKSHLVHTDLPKLRATDFVEYDDRRKIVRLSNPPGFFEDILDAVATFDQPEISR